MFRKPAALFFPFAAFVFLNAGSCSESTSPDSAASRFTIVTNAGWNDLVLDTRTGKTWSRDANLLALVPSINPNGFGVSISTAYAFVRATNDQRFGGYSDWRLPTISEFKDLVGSGFAGGPLPGPFNNVLTAHGYWSTTSQEKCQMYTGCLDYYQTIFLSDGIVIESSENSNHYIWIVR
jgi:hypothetical protein